MTQNANVGGPESSVPDPRTTPAALQEPFSARKSSRIQQLQHLLHAHPAISPALLLVITAIAFTIVNSRFAEPATLSLLMQQTAIVAGLGVGQTLIILTAGIDLSIGIVAVMAMMVTGRTAVENGVPAPLAILLGIAVGAAAGAINGRLITRLKLPPFIVTLGTLSIFTAITLLYTKGRSVQGSEMPDLLTWTGKIIQFGSFSITNGILVVALIYLVIGFALSQTAWGRHVYAVGDDSEAARLIGIQREKVLFSVYVVAGIVCGIVGWVLIGRAGAATPNAISNANLESITAVVIGGTSLFGGRGGIVGTLFGALIVQSFSIGLSLAGVDDQYRVLAVGVLVIVAVSIDQWIRQVKP